MVTNFNKIYNLLFNYLENNPVGIAYRKCVINQAFSPSSSPKGRDFSGASDGNSLHPFLFDHRRKLYVCTYKTVLVLLAIIKKCRKLKAIKCSKSIFACISGEQPACLIIN